MVSPELLHAARRSVAELRSSGGLPAEQAGVILVALEAFGASMIPPVEPGRRWADLPDEIMEQVMQCVQAPSEIGKPLSRGCYSFEAGAPITSSWWRARLVCRTWKK